MSAFRPTGPRDPWASEVGEPDRFALFAFFAVMILFGGVAYGLYVRPHTGGGFNFDLDNLLWQDKVGAKLSQSLPGQLGEPPVPLTLKPGVAPGTTAASAAVVQPAATVEPATAREPTVQPVDKLFVPPVGAAMGIAGAQALPTATPLAAPPTPAPAPASQPAMGARYKVINTNGDGVYIRRTPALADRIVPWPENTVMEYAGQQTDAEGLHWARVKDPRGNVGWVPAQYLGPA